MDLLQRGGFPPQAWPVVNELDEYFPGQRVDLRHERNRTTTGFAPFQGVIARSHESGDRGRHPHAPEATWFPVAQRLLFRGLMWCGGFVYGPAPEDLRNASWF